MAPAREFSNSVQSRGNGPKFIIFVDIGEFENSLAGALHPQWIIDYWRFAFRFPVLRSLMKSVCFVFGPARLAL